jgi:hypothetical protein
MHFFRPTEPAIFCWTWTCHVDLGDGNQLKMVVGVVSAASQRSSFVLRLMASAYGMLKASTKPTRVYVVEFLCRFCKSSDGTIVVTGEHLVRI